MRSREEIQDMVDKNPEDVDLLQLLQLEVLLDIRDQLTGLSSVAQKSTGFQPMPPPSVRGG